MVKNLFLLINPFLGQEMFNYTTFGICYDVDKLLVTDKKGLDISKFSAGSRLLSRYHNLSFTFKLFGKSSVTSCEDALWLKDPTDFNQ